MVNTFREMVLTLRSMDFEITDQEANEVWKKYGQELNEQILYLANDLMLERKEWANQPTLEQCIEDAIKINKEGIDGVESTGVKTEESGIQNGTVDRENGPVDVGSGEPIKGIRDRRVPEGHDQSVGPCCRSGIIFARRKETDGRISNDYVFRCECMFGAKYQSIYPVWKNQQEYFRE